MARCNQQATDKRKEAVSRMRRKPGKAHGQLIPCKLRFFGTSKAELKDLIQKVLHHPDFDPDQVDHGMHERLMRAIAEEDILIWDKWEEGDGRNNCSFYQRPLKKGLEERLEV